MNSDRLEGNWHQLKGKVREQWGRLTEDDLEEIQGNYEKLQGRIQEAYGITKDEAKKRINEWNNVEQ